MRPPRRTPHLPAPSATQTSQSDADTRNISSSIVSDVGLSGLPAQSVRKQCYNCGAPYETNSNCGYNCSDCRFFNITHGSPRPPQEQAAQVVTASQPSSPTVFTPLAPPAPPTIPSRPGYPMPPSGQAPPFILPQRSAAETWNHTAMDLDADSAHEEADTARSNTTSLSLVGRPADLAETPSTVSTLDHISKTRKHGSGFRQGHNSLGPQADVTTSDPKKRKKTIAARERRGKERQAFEDLLVCVEEKLPARLQELTDSETDYEGRKAEAKEGLKDMRRSIREAEKGLIALHGSDAGKTAEEIKQTIEEREPMHHDR